MKIHLRFCTCCQNFEKQSDKIDESLKALFSTEEQPQVKASENFKARMREQFKNMFGSK